jgi:diguanylate cyclase (GGDEF)-like protein
MEGPEAGRAYPLRGNSVAIGRDTANDVVIGDSCVSRRHASVSIQGQFIRLEDLGSQNGVYVNGQRVRSKQLQSGDLVQLGARVGFVFQWVSGAHLRLIKQLYNSSTRDALTGVHNRKHFQDRLAAEVSFCRRHGSDLGLGLAVIDIDHFKFVNDTYGHPAGDVVLERIANHMARQVRHEDLFARIGGEEFAVVLRHSNIEGCYSLAERLRISVEALPIHIDELALAVTLSLGCASLKGTAVTAQALLELADERLYQAKRNGRNRTVGG